MGHMRAEESKDFWNSATARLDDRTEMGSGKRVAPLVEAGDIQSAYVRSVSTLTHAIHDSA